MSIMCLFIFFLGGLVKVYISIKRVHHRSISDSCIISVCSHEMVKDEVTIQDSFLVY